MLVMPAHLPRLALLALVLGGLVLARLAPANAADLTPPSPLQAVAINSNSILITFDEPIDPASVDVFGFSLLPLFGGDPIGPAFVSLLDETRLLLVFPGNLETWLGHWAEYEVSIQEGAVADINGNILTPDTRLPLLQSTVILPWLHAWTFHVDNFDWSQASPPYHDPDFDDSSWSTGFALLGRETNLHPDLADLGLNSPVPSHNITIPVTTYYLAHFYYNPLCAEVTHLELTLAADDGALVYLNGTEILRLRLPEDPITTFTLAGTAVEAHPKVLSASLPNICAPDGTSSPPRCTRPPSTPATSFGAPNSPCSPTASTPTATSPLSSSSNPPLW